MEETDVQQNSVMPFGHDWDDRLDEWLAIVGQYDPYGAEDCDAAPTCSFPSDALIKEYLVNVESRPEGQVLHLLRCFLFEYVTFGADGMYLDFLRQTGGSDFMDQFRPTEHGRRLRQRPNMAHPGVRWVLDLLPGSPQRAIDVIDAYVVAYGQTLPDGRLSGLWDAAALISARYMSRKSQDGPAALRNLSPRQLEQLAASLYTKMGFQCELTQATRDGGRDVIARLELPGRREHRVIDCAHYAGSVPITKARAILGVAYNEHATSAVLLTTGYFSKATKKEASGNSKLDLVDGVRLIEMLDENFGHDWPQLIDYWIQWPTRG
ncbi:restriction endonuclease [Arthrobacter sp. NPDC055585]